MASNAAGGGQLPSAGAGVHGDGLLDDKAIGDVLADGLAGVGVGQLVDLVGVEPDLALSAAGDGCRQALLGAEVDPAESVLDVCPRSILHVCFICAMFSVKGLRWWCCGSWIGHCRRSGAGSHWRLRDPAALVVLEIESAFLDGDTHIVSLFGDGRELGAGARNCRCRSQSGVDCVRSRSCLAKP